jgi:hypothetical protein
VDVERVPVGSVVDGCVAGAAAAGAAVGGMTGPAGAVMRQSAQVSVR